MRFLGLGVEGSNCVPIYIASTVNYMWHRCVLRTLNKAAMLAKLWDTCSKRNLLYFGTDSLQGATFFPRFNFSLNSKSNLRIPNSEIPKSRLSNHLEDYFRFLRTKTSITGPLIWTAHFQIKSQQEYPRRHSISSQGLIDRKYLANETEFSSRNTAFQSDLSKVGNGQD